MATQRHSFEVPLADFAATLLLQREVGQRAQLIAEQAAQLEPGCDVAVYVIEDQEDPSWVRKGLSGDLGAGSEQIGFRSGTLGMVAALAAPYLVLHGSQLAREDYAHLDVRRTLASLAYVPLLADGTLVGAIELVGYDRPLSHSLVERVGALAQLAAPALAAAVAYESERNSSLQSITRVTQMYDLEKVFNSNLEMDELLATIAAKVREVMSVQAANVWMVEGETVTLMRQEGGDITVEQGTRQGPADGIAGKISDDGEPVLIDDPDDERLRARNTKAEENAIFSLLALPLMDGESLVGVIEVVNRLDGQPFDEDDQFVLSNICETASNALHNASLLLAERKLEILHALVKVSAEITSTLNLERVLQTVVNGPSSVVPYERAAIALEERGRTKLRAVSGKLQVNTADPGMADLSELLQWAAFFESDVSAAQHGDRVTTTRAEAQEKFRRYFAAGGMRGFYTLPLRDDEGAVGILSFESSDPDFLGEAHLEMIRVLAAQATVAIRNASLYREVPFINVLEPLIQKKQKFLALEKRRRALFLASAAAAVIFLAVFPFPMRVEGGATVSPVRLAKIEPEVAGVVRQVYVREGQHVARGQVLADLEDWDYRAALAGAEAKYQTALSEMNRALANNDGAFAGVQRVQANYWQSEVQRDQERLEKTHLRSPVDGWVTTPHVQDFSGRKLAPGDNFAEVADNSTVTVNVAVDEPDLPLLRTGARGWVKLDGFPARTFKGTVDIISPQSEMAGDQRTFYARVEVSNPGNLIRAGMSGRAKVAVGWHPVGYVLFRRPAIWLYSKLWSWFAW
ncbi:MAG TPA: efflux RND transporter periplasmic adaptor subunit [Terriglobales bacterium]|nr:efflux RND transporter periplasmic adaptor subunit [Terriglobales bacterium]